MSAALRTQAARLRARPVLSAALVYAVLATAFLGPAVLPGKVLTNADSFWFYAPWVVDRPEGVDRPANPEFDDAPAQFLPFLRYTRRRLPDVPLWNPYIVSGRPFLANAQSAVFSPFSVPAYVLPFLDALELIAALKLFVAAFGMFLLARALAMRYGGALLAGTVYAFNLWIVTWLAFPHTSVWVLIPWLLLATEHLVRRPDLLSGAALAAGVGVQFLCGHPESSFHALVATVAFFVLRLVQRRRADRVRLRAPLVAFGAALAGGMLLAALVLLPFAELLLRSADLEQRAGAGDEQTTPFRYVLGALLPDYWGRPTGRVIDQFLLARALYAGALPLMLAAAALILRPRAERLAVAAIGAAALLVVLGVPPVFEAVTALPGFSSGHNTRLVVIYMLCLALLAGWGLDELTGRTKIRPPESESPPLKGSDPFSRAGSDRFGRRAWAVLGVGAALLLAPLLFVVVGGKSSWSVVGDALDVAWGFASAPGPGRRGDDTIRAASLLVWVGFAGAAFALLAARLRGRLAAVPFAVVALLLVAADLFRAGMGYNPAIDRDVASQPATGGIRYLQTRRPARFVTTGLVPQNTIPMRFRLYEARGYDLPIEKRYDRLWRTRLSPEFPSQVGRYPLFVTLQLPRVDARRMRFLSLLGVADVVQPGGDEPLRAPGLRMAYEGADLRVFANERALSRAWVVGAQRQVEGGEAALRAIGAPTFAPRAVAVTERRVPGVPTEAEPGAAGPAGRARIAEYAPERVLIDAQASRAGLVVLSDLHYPGWKAKVDGRDAEVEQVDYVLRGVRVPPGRHRVELRYQPLSWRIGWITTLVALAGLATAIALGIRRRRAARA